MRRARARDTLRPGPAAPPTPLGSGTPGAALPARGARPPSPPCSPSPPPAPHAGERGIGGAKCGATAATAVLYEANGQRRLLAANIGDARTLLIRGGAAIDLSEEHVPDK